MRSVVASAVVLFLLACLALAQPLPMTGTGPVPTPGLVPTNPGAPLPGTAGLTPPAAERTIDHLLDELEQLRAQRAEILKREEALVKEVMARAEKQNQRLSRLLDRDQRKDDQIKDVPPSMRK